MSRVKATRTVGGTQLGLPRRLLTALCLSLLLLLGCACGLAYAEDDDLEKSVPLFAGHRTKVPRRMGLESPESYVNSFASPFLVSGSGVMVAFAEARYAESDKKSVDIVARYIETEGPDWDVKVTENDGDNWKTQLALPGEARKAGVNSSVLSNPTAVIKDNKIYLLALTNQTNDNFQSRYGWHFALSVGAITDEVGDKKIEWGPSESLHFRLMQEVEKKGLHVLPSSYNSAFLTSKGTILFTAIATNKEGKRGYAILQLKDDMEQWEASFVEIAWRRHLLFFEWKEKLIRMFSGGPTDNTYVKEYDEVEKEWKDVDDALFRSLWITKASSRDFTSATIGDKTLLLFAEESRSTNWGKSKIPLWFTDGNRVGQHEWPIETPFTKVTSGGLVYRKNMLFSMYQDTGKGLGDIVFTRLVWHVGETQFMLNTWAEKDAYLSKPCSETAPKDASPHTLCVTPMPTDGLVGFLSNNSGANYWQDEYRFRNPEVIGKGVKNGHTFSGANEGAQWQLDQNMPENLYDFTRYGLTVVATVVIHETPEVDAPLLTVKGVGVNERLGLWYNGKQWKVVSNDGGERRAVGLLANIPYKVAIVLNNNTISAYANGIVLGSPLPISTPSGETFEILNLFIGYSFGPNINVTVTNVFLYKRVLRDTELKAASKTVVSEVPTDFEEIYKISKKTKPEPELTHKTEPEPELTNTTESVPKLTNTTESVPKHTSTTEMPRDPEDGSVCVRMSFTLLFLMVCFCLAIF